MPELVLKQKRSVVDVFRFELEPCDLHFLEVDSFTDRDLRYLFNKYCFDKDGYYKNLADCYDEDDHLCVSRD